MKNDGELYLLHHYLQKGLTPEYILNLNLTERVFYQASMELHFQEEGEKLKLLSPLP